MDWESGQRAASVWRGIRGWRHVFEVGRRNRMAGRLVEQTQRSRSEEAAIASTCAHDGSPRHSALCYCRTGHPALTRCSTASKEPVRCTAMQIRLGCERWRTCFCAAQGGFCAWNVDEASGVRRRASSPRATARAQRFWNRVRRHPRGAAMREQSRQARTEAPDLIFGNSAERVFPAHAV
ncbi:hypothetical protein FA95DRAFT_1395538 [Auriscalpium vulgare]|uniref:Uncharacterized protein n=1 Tax=Auriscalpium vulgare TaxID=40419 RepID=A0ACB8RRL9_9AGAM|nr:hypothetical protein FA95DRAFT_1395538 [Auriscalpium vulgare]